MKGRIRVMIVKAHLKRLFLAYIEGQFADPSWASLRHEIGIIIGELED